jgi:hypothetical protein
VLIWSNALIWRTFCLPRAATGLTVLAEGDQCNGSPHMTVTVDGVSVMSMYVNATRWTPYSLPVSIPAGSHLIKIVFDNDYYGACDRNLRVDRFSLSY